MGWPAFWVGTASHELSATFGRYPGKEELFGVGPIWDPLGLKPENPEALREMENKELNNGRLAMFAAAGAIVQELLTGKGVPSLEQALRTHLQFYKLCAF